MVGLSLQKIPQNNRSNIEYKIYDLSQTPLQNETIFYDKYIVLAETRELLEHLIEKANGFWYYNGIGWNFIYLIEWEEKWQKYQELTKISDNLAYIVKAAKHGEFN